MLTELNESQSLPFTSFTRSLRTITCLDENHRLSLDPDLQPPVNRQPGFRQNDSYRSDQLNFIIKLCLELLYYIALNIFRSIS